MSKLLFDAREVRAVIQKSKAATREQRMPTFSDPVYDKNYRIDQAKLAKWRETAKPGLWLVHDSGVYLMPSTAGSDVLAYAEGCDPRPGESDDCWDTSLQLVGGDDFCQDLPLAQVEALVNGEGLNEQREVVKFVIYMTPKSFRLGVVTQPRKPTKTYNVPEHQRCRLEDM